MNKEMFQKNTAAKTPPAEALKIRAELIAAVRGFQDSADGDVIKNLSREGFIFLRLEELKKAVILLARLALDEGKIPDDGRPMERRPRVK